MRFMQTVFSRHPSYALGKWWTMVGMQGIVGAKGIVGIAIAAMLGVAILAPLTAAKTTHIDLLPGPFAPDARGEVVFSVESGVLSGMIKAQNLPAQGPHAFYVLWFVRTDTGDKAFLGPVVNHDSILFMTAGNAEMRFSAPAFTAGHPGLGISLGASGTNFFVLIAENKIDTFVPFPVSVSGMDPSPSFALTATF